MFPIGENADSDQRMAEMFGPGQVDHMVRQAIQLCWIGLPKERRSVEEVETQVRRIVDRALRDFREDWQAFNKTSEA